MPLTKDPGDLSNGSADDLGVELAPPDVPLAERPVFHRIDRLGRLYVLVASFGCHKHGPDQDGCWDCSNQVYGYTNLCHGHFDSFWSVYGRLDAES